MSHPPTILRFLSMAIILACAMAVAAAWAAEDKADDAYRADFEKLKALGADIRPYEHLSTQPFSFDASFWVTNRLRRSPEVDSWQFRLQAVNLLGITRAANADARLEQMLLDPKEDVRVSARAAWALARMQHPDTMPVLIQAMKDERYGIRAAAAAALEDLTFWPIDCRSVARRMATPEQFRGLLDIMESIKIPDAPAGKDPNALWAKRYDLKGNPVCSAAWNLAAVASISLLFQPDNLEPKDRDRAAAIAEKILKSSIPAAYYYEPPGEEYGLIRFLMAHQFEQFIAKTGDTRLTVLQRVVFGKVYYDRWVHALMNRQYRIAQDHQPGVEEEKAKKILEDLAAARKNLDGFRKKYDALQAAYDAFAAGGEVERPDRRTEGDFWPAGYKILEALDVPRTPESARGLEKTLLDRKEDLNASYASGIAALTLGPMQYPESIEPLVEAMKDTRYGVREVVAGALAEITFYPAGCRAAVRRMATPERFRGLLDIMESIKIPENPANKGGGPGGFKGKRNLDFDPASGPAKDLDAVASVALLFQPDNLDAKDAGRAAAIALKILESTDLEPFLGMWGLTRFLMVHQHDLYVQKTGDTRSAHFADAEHDVKYYRTWANELMMQETEAPAGPEPAEAARARKSLEELYGIRRDLDDLRQKYTALVAAYDHLERTRPARPAPRPKDRDPLAPL